MKPYELRREFYNLATAKTPWYKIINQADGPTQIHIFNTINGELADDFIGELNSLDGPVELRINSEGGELFQAKAIYNALSGRPDVTVIVDGLAASAASFIAMAASPEKLYMSRIATMMIHDGQTVAGGSASDMRRLADILDKESDTIAGIYAERTGKEASYFRNKMQSETWYNAQQALDEGLCDGVFDTRTGKVTMQVRKTAPAVGWADVVLADSFPDAEFYNRSFTTDDRKKLAKSGAAMPDGSYPIETCGDADNARTAYGRAPQDKRSAVAAHIRSREKTLKCSTTPFSPGADNQVGLDLSDEELQKFVSALKGA